jgi:hypothetical protein
MLYALTQEVLGDTGHTTLPSYDMWQLGCLVWWMCTGSHLFSDAPEQQQVVVSKDASSSASLQQADGMQQQQQGSALDGGEQVGLDPVEQHLAAMVCNFGPFPLEVSVCLAVAVVP